MDISSPDKVLFPDDGITKAEVVAHYELVGERMVDFLGGRPLTIERYPQGIAAKGFMQKNAAKHFPESIRRLTVPKRGDGETVYPVVTQADDLAYLANQNTITFHMWTSSADRPGFPDWLVIDLDPEADDLNGVRASAVIVRELLASFEISGFPMATGSKGFHIWVPLDGSADFGTVSRVSHALAGLAAAHDPELMTLEFLKKNRRGRVFVDWLRNGPTATVVVPFSLRARPGAPVAVPILWDELDGAEPGGWHLGYIEDRLSISGDVEPQALPVDAVLATAASEDIDLDTPHDRFGRT